jgi:hypothetical protein
MSKRLQLKVLDPTGVVVVTHHFDFNAGGENKLLLTIGDNQYLLDRDGKLIDVINSNTAKHEED